ncbi:hypothetical protein Patl1_15224 [Pistacia atlantica]|uniref:Uncharacterized protein n=1 Tax=Pistacia atlantica TaxID=434234 RepID=A0ACC1B9N3_9ROSI|nr:hypothetical protein Patl1_15224 [Pistacia atlantica]
MKSHRELELAI